MQNERSYVVGLPVILTVHNDGTVTYSVDLSEASDLSDTMTEMFVDGEWVEIPDSVVVADSERISVAFENETLLPRSEA